MSYMRWRKKPGEDIVDFIGLGSLFGRPGWFIRHNFKNPGHFDLFAYFVDKDGIIDNNPEYPIGYAGDFDKAWSMGKELQEQPIFAMNKRDEIGWRRYCSLDDVPGYRPAEVGAKFINCELDNMGYPEMKKEDLIREIKTLVSNNESSLVDLTQDKLIQAYEERQNNGPTN